MAYLAAAIEQAAAAAAVGAAVAGTSGVVEAHLQTHCKQQVLVLDTAHMLELLEAPALDTNQLNVDANQLDAVQRAALSRARKWLCDHPWELRKCKSQRANRSAVRLLCRREVMVSLPQLVNALLDAGYLICDESLQVHPGCARHVPLSTRLATHAPPAVISYIDQLLKKTLLTILLLTGSFL